MECVCLNELKYSIIETNIENVLIYAKKEDESSKIITIFDCREGNNFTKIQLKNIEKQVRAMCINEGYKDIKYVSIFYVKEIEFGENEIKKYNCLDSIVLNFYEGEVFILKNSKKEWEIEWLQEVQILEKSFENMFVKKFYRKKSVFKEIKENLKTVTMWIFIINVLVFLYEDFLISESEFNSFMEKGCVSWYYVIEKREIYRLITSIFMHVSLEHIAGNMFTLLIIGLWLEKIIGKYRLLFIYLCTGIIADLISISYNVINARKMDASIGASGAIFGIMGGLLAVFIANREKFGKGMVKRLVVYIGLVLYMGFTSNGIDNVAHIGGLIVGFIIGMIMFYFIPKCNKKELSED